MYWEYQRSSSVQQGIHFNGTRSARAATMWSKSRHFCVRVRPSIVSHECSACHCLIDLRNVFFLLGIFEKSFTKYRRSNLSGANLKSNTSILFRLELRIRIEAVTRHSTGYPIHSGTCAEARYLSRIAKNESERHNAQSRHKSLTQEIRRICIFDENNLPRQRLSIYGETPAISKTRALVVMTCTTPTCT